MNGEECNTVNGNAAYSGNIVLINRGNCEFGVKVLNAQKRGAVAVIVANNIAGAPFPMGAGAVGNQVKIPSLMVSLDDGGKIRSSVPTSNTLFKISDSPPSSQLDSSFDAGKANNKVNARHFSSFS